jgi:hypothetical protein
MGIDPHQYMQQDATPAGFVSLKWRAKYKNITLG